MQQPDIPQNEPERLAALTRYRILDTLPEQEYDDLTQLASAICQTPIALISLIDQDRQWFKSCVGITATETPRDISFCAHVVANASTLIVPDTTQDCRFSANPFVLQEPKIRFYAGAPLMTHDGYALGTLCVIDYRPKALTPQQLQQLEVLSRLVISQLELRFKETQLHQTNQELLRATRLKDEFLANMSHELRTPLNAILGMAEALQELAFGPLLDCQIEALKTIESSGTHLLSLITDILDVAKIESGQMELELTPTAIAPLCKSSLTFIQQQASQKRLQVDVKLPSHLPDLLVDARRIRQVLINLLNNAVKFTPEGGRITLEVSHHRALPPQKCESLQIAITDTGIGIAPDNMQKLFQPFVQIDSALNRQYPGTGLGLTLVKQIVELHGGRVDLTSQLQIGSCFTIELPCTPVDPQPSTELAGNPSSLNFASDLPPSPLILLAEDNEANAMTITHYLEAKGYRIVLAQSGQAAIELNRVHQPDLILMDIQMPGMDGLEALGHIRRDPTLAQVPIIALTALAMAGDRDRCLAAGANEYLAKPVKLKELVETIQHWLASPTEARTGKSGDASPKN